MKLYVLFAQRKESYEGEYAPEALECIDDVGNDDNPAWLISKMKDANNEDDEFVSAKIFEIELPKGSGDFIRNQLMGKIPPIKAVNIGVMEE